MVKDILLVVENSACTDPIVHAVVEMAERLSADLTIEVLTASPVLLPALLPMTTIYLPDWAMTKDEAERLRQISDMVANSPAVTRVMGLRDDVSGLANRAGRGGPIADLIIMGGADHWQTPWLRRNASETIVMGAGAPLLVLAGGNAMPPIQNAVIGWKDSPEARRALHDLMMLAEPRAKVSVVTVGRSGDEAGENPDSAGEVVRHLVRHGLRAEHQQLERNGLSDAETLEAFALRDNADILAIGAFGHSRLREVVFGGVTRTLIDHPRLPILFAR